MTHAAGPPTDPALPALFDERARPAADDAEIGWYDAWLPRGRGRVLDVLCGVGRLTAPLARRGHALHGVDPSPERLARCAARLAAAGVSAPLYPQTPDRLNLPTRYAGAFIGSCAFQRIADPRTAHAALERLRAHLIEPGLLAIDAFVPDYAASRPGAPWVDLEGVALDDGTSIRLRSETTIDARAPHGASERRYTRRRGSLALGEWRERVEWTWYEPAELARLVTIAGWNEVRVVDAPPSSPEAGTRSAIFARA